MKFWLKEILCKIRIYIKKRIKYFLFIKSDYYKCVFEDFLFYSQLYNPKIRTERISQIDCNLNSKHEDPAFDPQTY